MKKNIILLLISVLFYPLKTDAQSKFILKNDLKYQKIAFQLVNNIIIIPIEINGKELSFILDSGVSSTVLFNLNPSDSLELKDVETIKLQGLGEGDDVDALKSSNNHFRIKNIQNNQQSIFIILHDKIDLSAKLGITIHGIIGYDLLKDFILKIDYQRKQITFYPPEKYKYKKCSSCETFDLEFNKNKPYVDGFISIFEDSSLTSVKLLIDSGGSDALWLFENSKNEIVCPPKNFVDYLGEGLSGSVFGKRSRINHFKLGKFEFEQPTVSFPDSISIEFVRTFKERNGSLGGNILKRFTVILDYPNKKMTLKKNGFYREPFNYNMSGLELMYNGQTLVKEQEATSFTVLGEGTRDKKEIVINYGYRYNFRPSYIIHQVREGSPAFDVGIQKNDVLITINGEPAYKYKLEELMYILFRRENDKIKMEIERNGIPMKFEFRLKKMF